MGADAAGVLPYSLQPIGEGRGRPRPPPHVCCRGALAPHHRPTINCWNLALCTLNAPPASMPTSSLNLMASSLSCLGLNPLSPLTVVGRGRADGGVEANFDRLLQHRCRQRGAQPSLFGDAGFVFLLHGHRNLSEPVGSGSWHDLIVEQRSHHALYTGEIPWQSAEISSSLSAVCSSCISSCLAILSSCFSS